MEAITALSRYYQPFVVKDSHKPRESCVLAEIRTEHPLNATLGPFCYTDQLDETHLCSLY
jgi:hypothetical protein